MVVSPWLVSVSCWANPARSLRTAAAVVRQYASGLVSSWGGEAQLVSVLERIARVITLTCHMTKRKKQPSTYQLLRDPALLANRGGLA